MLLDPDLLTWKLVKGHRVAGDAINGRIRVQLIGRARTHRVEHARTRPQVAGSRQFQAAQVPGQPNGSWNKEA